MTFLFLWIFLPLGESTLPYALQERADEVDPRSGDNGASPLAGDANGEEANGDNSDAPLQSATPQALKGEMQPTSSQQENTELEELNSAAQVQVGGHSCLTCMKKNLQAAVQTKLFIIGEQVNSEDFSFVTGQACLYKTWRLANLSNHF